MSISFSKFQVFFIIKAILTSSNWLTVRCLKNYDDDDDIEKTNKQFNYTA